MCEIVQVQYNSNLGTNNISINKQYRQNAQIIE